MANNAPIRDPILDELHAVRRHMHDDCGGDLAEIVARMRKRQSDSGHPIASIPVPNRHRTRECTGAADTVVSDGESSPAAR